MSKRYGLRRPWVVHDADLTLEPGMLVRVVGQNGSGKSTLLRLMAGVIPPTAGAVRHSPRFDGLTIAFVPQEGGALPHLTVAENILLATSLSGRRVPSRLTDRWYVDDLSLGPLLDVRFGELSGGFKRLAALCCAMATQPDGMFLDEPLSGVDAAHTQAVSDGLLAASSNMEFLVLTTHDVSQFDAASRTINVTNGVPDECC